MKGFSALTFDFRGRGRSEGWLRPSLLQRDVRAAIGLLRDRGYDRLVCMGASMGGTACLSTAIEADLQGLVVIASTMTLGYPTRLRPQDLPQLAMPKLYVCAEDDTVDGSPTGLAETMTFLYDNSPEPRELVVFPGTAHGTELFDTEHGDELRELLVGFLEGLR